VLFPAISSPTALKQDVFYNHQPSSITDCTDHIGRRLSRLEKLPQETLDQVINEMHKSDLRNLSDTSMKIRKVIAASFQPDLALFGDETDEETWSKFANTPELRAKTNTIWLFNVPSKSTLEAIDNLHSTLNQDAETSAAQTKPPTPIFPNAMNLHISSRMISQWERDMTWKPGSYYLSHTQFEAMNLSKLLDPNHVCIDWSRFKAVTQSGGEETLEAATTDILSCLHLSEWHGATNTSQKMEVPRSRNTILTPHVHIHGLLGQVSVKKGTAYTQYVNYKVLSNGYQEMSRSGKVKKIKEAEHAARALRYSANYNKHGTEGPIRVVLVGATSEQLEDVARETGQLTISTSPNLTMGADAEPCSVCSEM
jgi:hypothetical protein